MNLSSVTTPNGHADLFIPAGLGFSTIGFFVVWHNDMDGFSLYHRFDYYWYNGN
jgi:hypothetical protein